jgi:hypothetical protein
MYQKIYKATTPHGLLRPVTLAALADRGADTFRIVEQCKQIRAGQQAARARLGDEIVRRIAAETGITPILIWPFRHQHLFEIELAAVWRGTIVPPAERKCFIRRRSAPALFQRLP